MLWYIQVYNIPVLFFLKKGFFPCEIDLVFYFLGHGPELANFLEVMEVAHLLHFLFPISLKPLQMPHPQSK